MARLDLAIYVVESGVDSWLPKPEVLPRWRSRILSAGHNSLGLGAREQGDG